MNVELFLVGTFGLPALAAAIFGLCLWFDRGLSERLFARITATAFVGGLGCSVIVLASMLSQGRDSVEVALGQWFGVGSYHFGWALSADKLSIPIALFFAALLGLIGVFSQRYLHKEPGFFRFYFLLTLFASGVELVVLASSLDLIFVGWEVVGVTSALLIAFFNDREKPVNNGLRAFVTYRLCDIGLLVGTVWLHHSAGTSHMSAAAESGWSGLPVPVDGADALFVGLCLLWATMGKSAQVPLGGWLPRAMEGPTPSSAIFYGAISIHLGPYLLLRASPLLEAQPVVAGLTCLVGFATAMHATFVGRVQTDIKSVLAYASMTQVGLIFVEIGLGFRHLALVHIVGHAALRSLQILRSPSLLHEHHHLEQAVGAVLPRTGAHLERWVPKRLQPWLYRHALERGYFDALLIDYVVGGFTRFVRSFERLDSRWTTWIASPNPSSAKEQKGSSS